MEKGRRCRVKGEAGETGGGRPTAGPRGFEIEAGSLGEFFELLDDREVGQGVTADYFADGSGGTLLRRAVYVSLGQNRGYAGYGFPDRVVRYVEAAFLWGEDLVSHRRETSHGLELWGSEHFEERNVGHYRVFEEFRREVERGLGVRRLDVPVVFGSVRFPPAARVTRVADERLSDR